MNKYTSSHRQVITLSIGMLFFLCVLSILSLCVGETIVSPFSIFNLSALDEFLLFDLRLPRTLMAISCGAALGGAGVVFQVVFKNPLADPYLLGISSGGALGAIVAIGFFSSVWGVILSPNITTCCAFMGSLSTLGIVFLILRIRRTTSPLVILLCGVVLSFLFSSISMFLLTLSSPIQVSFSLNWLLGDLSRISLFPSSIMLALTLLILLTLIRFTHSLNLLSLGDDFAKLSGISVTKISKWLLVIFSILLSAQIAFAGVISFVGLIVPHLGRMLVGSDNRILYPMAIFLGACFLLLADIISRTIYLPLEIPVGIVTAIIGAPVFFLLLFKNIKLGNDV